MNLPFLILIHITGLICLVLGFGILFVVAQARLNERKDLRLPGIILHGIGLITLIISGFILATNLGQGSNHAFLGAKLILWLLLGGLIVPFRIKPQYSQKILALVVALIMIATYVGLNKGF